MVLSDRDIKRYMELGKIRITPEIDPDLQLGPCSVDLRLGHHFKVFEYSRFSHVDIRTPASSAIMREVVIDEAEPFVIQPGELVLATTYEKLELSDDVLARLEGRSSLARLGIIVHGTAGVFEPGWTGHAVLELGNLGRMAVALYPMMRVCSFTFEQLSSPAERPYRSRKGSKYVDQTGAEASRLWSDPEVTAWGNGPAE